MRIENMYRRRNSLNFKCVPTIVFFLLLQKMASDIEDSEIPVTDYVIISEEEIDFIDTDYEDISDTEALKVRLQDERIKNKRYFDKLKDLSKKYRKALKKIEYQQIIIEELSKVLQEERENRKNSCLLAEDFAHVAYGSLKIEECDESNAEY